MVKSDPSAGPNAREQWVDPLLARIGAIARWVSSKPAWLISGLLIGASLARDGIVVWNWFELSPGLLNLWASPASAFQSNLLFNAIGSAWQGLGLDPAGGPWLVAQIALTFAVFSLLSVLVIKRAQPGTAYVVLAVLLSGGLAAVLWREIGRYDALFVAGIALAMLARKPSLIWLGVAIAALTSPEQLLAAGILLLLLSLLPDFACWRREALRLTVAAAVVLLFVQLWFIWGGAGGNTRIGVLVAHFSGQSIEAASAYDTKQSFTQFTIEKAMVSLSAGPGLVWSYLGAAVFFVLLFALLQRRWLNVVLLLAVVILIPIIAGFTFGEDRTRDISLIMAPIILVLVLEGATRLPSLVNRLPGPRDQWLTWIAILVSLIPITYFYLYAEEPFRWMKELVVALNNGVAVSFDGSTR